MGEPAAPAPAAAGGLFGGDHHRARRRAGVGAGEQHRIGRIAAWQEVDVETGRGITQRGGNGGNGGRHGGFPVVVERRSVSARGRRL
jgi:hypothetical protein